MQSAVYPVGSELELSLPSIPFEPGGESFPDSEILSLDPSIDSKTIGKDTIFPNEDPEVRFRRWYKNCDEFHVGSTKREYWTDRAIEEWKSVIPPTAPIEPPTIPDPDPSPHAPDRSRAFDARHEQRGTGLRDFLMGRDLHMLTRAQINHLRSGTRDLQEQLETAHDQNEELQGRIKQLERKVQRLRGSKVDLVSDADTADDAQKVGTNQKPRGGAAAGIKRAVKEPLDAQDAKKVKRTLEPSSLGATQQSQQVDET